jgi:uncharacterized protein (DUF849 family)
MVAPNGARLGKADHPEIPVTLDEILTCAEACHQAGAGGLHLHLRDDHGGHLLDTGAYRDALAALSERCPDLLVQITTEAADRYGPGHQRHVALHSGATHVSVSVREICREPQHAPGFYQACAEAGIAVQHILYDEADGVLLQSLLPPDLFQSPELQLIHVLGRYTPNTLSRPDMLQPALDWQGQAGITPDWAVCAFGLGETACLIHAAELGGACRIGFENARLRADGSVARDNAQRVADLVQALKVQVACTAS